MSSVRRQPVAADGGLFSTPKVSFSRETQELLKVMMQESKLTSFQQRQLRDSMHKGGPLPLRCHPTSSKPGCGGKATPPKKTPSKQLRPQLGSGLRTKETIEKRASEEEPDYRPPPNSYNSSKEKQKLQNVMAYGSELEPVLLPKTTTTSSHHNQEEREMDRFDELVQEVEERREFLSEMEALGQGKKYRTQITTEISQRIREMEELDRERCREMTLELS